MWSLSGSLSIRARIRAGPRRRGALPHRRRPPHRAQGPDCGPFFAGQRGAADRAFRQAIPLHDGCDRDRPPFCGAGTTRRSPALVQRRPRPVQAKPVHYSIADRARGPDEAAPPRSLLVRTPARRATHSVAAPAFSVASDHQCGGGDILRALEGRAGVQCVPRLRGACSPRSTGTAATSCGKRAEGAALRTGRVNQVVGRVKVQHQLLGRVCERGNELLHEYLINRAGAPASRRYARTASKAARLRASRLNSTATRWIGYPRWRYLSA